MQAEWDQYISAWDKAGRQKKEYNLMLAKKAYQQAKFMASILGKEFGARRVYLFGSLLRPEYFDEGSDIDLGVEGLAPNLFLKAERRLEEVTDFPFDLVDINEIIPSLAEVIYNEGEILYAG
ncbi:MAG: uncharacterized protein PWP65_93 [Clostridia bacterium]|nr:uncharacterized protein [Clostridia bacterium]